MTPHVSITLLRTQTDERLVELIAAGHDRAFDAIVDRYRRPLLRYARRFLREETRAEDVVQSAFVSAWTALNDGVTVRDLRPWLYRIVHNGALNVMKKPGRDDAVLIEASDLRPGPATEVEQREDVRQALDTIAGLPERQRTALLAVAFDGRSHADVGAELGLKEPAVRQLVSRARTTLRVAATAITPWPAAVWLAGVGGTQAGDTAARVGEVVGGVGAGTVFGGGALKAGALVAAAGALAVGAPRMAEVAHHHAPRTVATASAATAAGASTRSPAATGSGPAATPIGRARFVSTASGRLTAGARANGRSGGTTSGSWSRTARGTTPGTGGTTGELNSIAAPQTVAPQPAVSDQQGTVDTNSPSQHRHSMRSGRDDSSSTDTLGVREHRRSSRTPAGVTGAPGSGDSSSGDSGSGSPTDQRRSGRVEHGGGTDPATPSTDSGSSGSSGSKAPEVPEAPETDGSAGSGSGGSGDQPAPSADHSTATP